MKPLRLVHDGEPTRQIIALAEIEREHKKSKWTAFDEPRKRPALDTDDVLRRAAFVPTVEPQGKWYRRLVEWVRSL